MISRSNHSNISIKMMISPLKCSINISYSNEISDSLGLGTYGHRNTRQQYQFTVKAAADAGQATGEHEEKNDGGLVLVNPKQGKKDSFSSKAIDWLEKLIIREQKQQHYHQPPPFHFLSHNFAPVIEETPPASKHLPIKTGHFPECLNGEFMRVGPNPKFAPVFGYHWFDGDGMIHGVRIKDGKARYASRYVRTSRLIQEEFLGCAKFLKIGDAKGLLGLLMGGLFFLRQIFRVLDFSYGYGTANTALTYHHGKLLALHEGDKPYVIKILEDGDMETIGMWDYEKRLNHPLTAHPKIDPVTGEMFTFGYSQLPPYVIYRVISKDGYMNDPVPISVSGPIMMHDFAITENYAIFVDAPMYFRPQDMVKDEKLILTFDATKSARFGVLPRYAKNDSQIKWFELPSCFISHNANAWEEGDEVVLITCRLEYMDLESYNGTIRDKIENIKYQLYEMRFNLITGEAFQKKLSQPAIDFPKVNDNYIGRKNQYVYGSIFDSVGRVEGIIKFDLHEEPETGKSKLEVGGNVKGIFDIGAGRFGSETIFVPRQPDLTSEEDDGYLIFFVHDVNTGKSEMNVIDAKTMAHDPVAVVELPNRVPYGFHALFVTEAQLEEQWK